MKTILFRICFVFILIPSFVKAQESIKYLCDKPGKFFIQNNLNKCTGQDIISLTNNLTTITAWLQQNNSAINPPVGFDVAINLFGNSCDKAIRNEEFGIYCSIGFTFRYFYIENGVSKTASDWIARGSQFNINNPFLNIATQFVEHGFDTDDPPQLKIPLEKALENLKRYYSINPIEKEIAPGVVLYAGGNILVFNPNQPDISIPVSVKEAMEAKMAYYKIKQEIDGVNYGKNLTAWAKMGINPEISSQLKIYDAIKAEYDNFTADELNEWAYSSSSDGISMINAQKKGAQVVRFNPACWDKLLPTSAIQFLSIEYQSASTSELESYIQRNNGVKDYIGLFYNNLPIEKMVDLIHKKNRQEK